MNLEYILGLKKEVGLLNEKVAKERYLELLAMGYSEHEIVLATPVPVQVHLNIGQPTTVENSETDMTTDGPGKTAYTNVAGLNPGGEELPSDTLS